MPFELIPILEQIKDLYQLPLGKERFDAYLDLLQGDSKDDMVLPIAGFNPMGKALAQAKLNDLMAIDVEAIAQTEIQKVNKELSEETNRVIYIGINLIDDVEGAWSSQQTTDYKSKFEIGSLLKRNFCTPCFWTSETLDEELAALRIREYIYRSVYWMQNEKHASLADLFEQEVFVSLHGEHASFSSEVDFSSIEMFYKKHSASTDFNLKFNFFYGDTASMEMGYSVFGIGEKEGFRFAEFMADKRLRIVNANKK